jgi:hypothetical protein
MKMHLSSLLAAIVLTPAASVLAQTNPQPTAPASATAPAGHYKSFAVAMYCPIGTINLQNLPATWASITSQVKVDKVYIETFRSRRTIDESTIEPIKKFFIDHGVRVAGGVTLVSNDSGQFVTFSYADAGDRALVKSITEMTARHFDEIILDDFFFYATKTDADIAAKGDKSWTQHRLDAMREASANLVVAPAKAINPRIKMVIKFPNWYEHFQGLGYDLEQEPRIFDGIYTGTETRDPLLTEQHLQPYESYNIIRYFENIKPGGNGGGWVDGYQYNVVDRYAEQLWDTVFAKAPEMMLFNFAQIQQGIQVGDRPWADQATSFNYNDMLATYQPGETGPRQPQMARAAGYALELADKVVCKLGKPIGLKSYRPYQATGEDFLHNFLGMTGIPIDLYPTFPDGENSHTLLLTEAAKLDPEIIKKIKSQLAGGKNVIITSGLVKALLGKGLEDICELEYTGNKIQVTSFHGQGGAAIPNSELKSPVIFPEIKFKTNDAWYVLAGVANGNGFPILISDKYSRGVLYVLAIPDNFADLYSLPPAVLSVIRGILLRDLPVMTLGQTDPQVALFEYDNNTFIVQNFSSQEKPVTVAISGHNSIRDLLTDQIIQANPPAGRGARRGGFGRTGFTGGTPDARSPDYVPPRPTFAITLKPHSWQAFIAEN